MPAFEQHEEYKTKVWNISLHLLQIQYLYMICI